MSDTSRAESRLRRALRCAPQPLPQGRFPLILDEARGEGYSEEALMNAVDEWLACGLCRITDQITCDIEITEKGRPYFGGVVAEEK